MVAIVYCVMNKENIAFSFTEVFRGLNTNIIRLLKNKKSAITRAGMVSTLISLSSEYFFS